MPAQADRLAVGHHPVAADGGPQGAQDTAQPGTRPALVELRPEEAGQHVTMMSAPGDHQVSQQRNGLLPIHRHGATGTLDERGAEKVELDIVCSGADRHGCGYLLPETGALQRF